MAIVQVTFESFAAAWSAKRHCKIILNTNLRLFELLSVKAPLAAQGRFRMARPDDETTVFRWLNEFHKEAIPNDPQRPETEILQDIRNSIAKNQFFIWENQGQCVCLAGSRRETATERWISPVYTPLEFRGHGYASSLVAAVSQQIVESGKKGMLFTDLANPTSNSIYTKLGYMPVADFKHFLFS